MTNCVKLVCAGDQAFSQTHTIPWRLKSDVCLVSYEKEVMPLAKCIAKVAVEKGLAEIQVWDHVLEAKKVGSWHFQSLCVQGGEGPDASDVPFRYTVREPEGNTNAFKPNPVSAEAGTYKSPSIGAIFLGQLQQVPRVHGNKIASLVWEAGSGFISEHVVAGDGAKLPGEDPGHKAEGLHDSSFQHSTEDMGAALVNEPRSKFFLFCGQHCVAALNCLFNAPGLAGLWKLKLLANNHELVVFLICPECADGSAGSSDET